MKIVFFTSYYFQYLSFFYKKNNNFFKSSYNDQMKSIISDYFGVVGSYFNYANKLGAEAHLIIVNCEPMQKQWAKENGINYNEKNWMNEIAIEQVKRIKPDIFFI